jgi:hypothetical protein
LQKKWIGNSERARFAADNSTGKQNSQARFDSRQFVIASNVPRQQQPARRVTNTTYDDRKDAPAMKPEHVENKRNFREHDSVLVVLAPQKTEIEMLNFGEMLRHAPVIPERNREIEGANGAQHCYPI